jgi:hypothetical protein
MGKITYSPTMLDQYQGVFICKVESNDSCFVEARVTDAIADKDTTGMEDELWLGTKIQIHPENLNMNGNEFEDAYPEGSEFIVKFDVKVLSKGTTPDQRKAKKVGKDRYEKFGRRWIYICPEVLEEREEVADSAGA